jgi:cytidylate kinase
MSETWPAAIAIDGPAASGKTTLGLLLAESLAYLLVDTGVMYRAATLAALRNGVPCGDEAAVTALTRQIEIVVEAATAATDNATDGRLYTVRLDGEDVTWALRSAEVDANVSQVSAWPGVREELVQRQRDLAAGGRVILVGRDIGTVVLPDAPLKLYVTASAAERARRRFLEQQGRPGAIPYAEILAAIEARDAYDSSRTHSPLMPAHDAVLIDTTERESADIAADLLTRHFPTPHPCSQ